MWYAYEPGGELRIVTSRTPRNGRLLEKLARFSVCAQTESPPYGYVSVEGSIVGVDTADVERDLRPLARRYLGDAGGDAYIAATRDEHRGNVVVRMRPERWLTADYTRAAAGH